MNVINLQRALRGAVRDALDVTARQVAMIIADEIAKEVGGKRAQLRGALKKKVKIINKEELVRTIIPARGATIPLNVLAPRQDATGVSVPVGGGQVEHFRHAFIQRGRKGRSQVYIRKSINGKLVPRYPIVRVKGIPLSRYFKLVINRIDKKRVQSILANNITQQLLKRASNG